MIALFSPKAIFTIFLLFVFFFYWPHQVLAQSGPIIVGDNTVGCTGANAGGVRYVTASNILQYCNGSAWTTLGSGGGGLWTQSGSDIYYNTGKVGIGTAAPADRLHLAESDTNGPTLILENTHSTANASALAFTARGSTKWYITTDWDEDGGQDFQIVDGPSGDKQRLVIDGAGNVGIGTASPGTKLTVSTASDSYGVMHTDGTRSIGTWVDNDGGWFGTESNHDLHFFTNDGGPRITLKTSGNVGIGETSPVQKLHVTSATSWDGIKVQGGTANGGINGLMISNNNGYEWHIGVNGSTNPDGNNRFSIWDDWVGEDRLVIDDSGNVGIGATSPANMLHVYNSSSSVNEGVAGVQIEGHQDGQAQVQLVTLGDGTKSVEDELAGVKGWLVQGFGNNYQGDAAWRNDFALDYWDGSSWYEPFRIDSATKNVGINTTTPSERLHVNGRIRVDSLASSSGTHVCINSNVLSSCSSSLRYKENIRDFGMGLDTILKMRPVSFKWKERDETDFGFIAEEMREIDPLFVTYRDGQVEGVKYDQLTAVLVNAVKELKTENDDLRQRLEVLESRFDGRGQ